MDREKTGSMYPLSQFIAVLIKEIIFIWENRVIINKRYLGNGYRCFIDNDAFAFRIIHNKRITAAKVLKKYVLSSFVTAIIQFYKFIFSAFKSL